jgi:mannosyltransferase OCH1-like enzyme
MFNKKKYLNYVYIFLILLIITLIIILYKTKRNVQEPFKDLKDDSILLATPNEDIKTIYVRENIKPNKIPLNIFMCWNTKNLPPKMNKNINKIKEENPDFNIYVFDDKECRNMIEKYFVKDVLDAFDSLIPGAYKADLWRYCALYLYGGIYQDIKLESINGFRYKDIIDDEYYVKDIKESNEGIYNAFMVCKQNNKILEKAIKKIIINCREKYYGDSILNPTGPLLLKMFFSQFEIDNLKLKLINKSKDIKIVFNNKEILKMYNGYRDEQNEHFKEVKSKYYMDLWHEKNIYRA